MGRLTLRNWLVTSLAILIGAYLIPGVAVSNIWVVLVAAFVLGLINAVIRPILILLTLPVTIVTLGLFTFVINAFMILLTNWIVPGFSVASFWWALLFGLVISIVTFGLGKMLPRRI